MITSPSEELLLKYVSGVLDPALHLLVEQHLALHPASLDVLPAWQELGGAMLAAETPVEITAGRLEVALACLPAPEAAVRAAQFPSLDTLPWRWAGPGRAIANIDIPGSTMKTYAIRIAPGKAMLQHSHAAKEWTLIVQGAYRDESGAYDAGSFIEEDDATDHRPVATGTETCICLAVMSGPLAAPGLMGRMARWMMR